jgi:hypothetical protein
MRRESRIAMRLHRSTLRACQSWLLPWRGAHPARVGSQAYGRAKPNTKVPSYIVTAPAGRWPAAQCGRSTMVLSDIGMAAEVNLRSVITCPACGVSAEEEMPTDACVVFYPCTGCQKVLRPLAGDCCVFCSFGSVKCPPVQMEISCCK